MQKLTVTGIKEFEALAEKTDDCISLSQGVLRIGGVPAPIKEYLASILATDKADYYESAYLTSLLQDKLADSLHTRYGVKIQSKQILITHGCIGAIGVVLQTILDAGDEVILPEPTYPVYQNSIALAKGTPVFVASQVQGTNTLSWDFDVDKIKAATTPKTKAILFSNPVNPLGITIGKQTLTQRHDWCVERGIYLIVDEVYEDYIFSGDFYSATNFIPDSQWVVRTSSFSKSFAMSGWRVGYMVLPQHLMAACDVTQHALMICPNVLAQWAAVFALDHPHLQEPFRKTIETNKDLAQNMLAPLADAGKIAFAPPTAGFFLFIQTQQDSAELCMEILQNAKVALVPGTTFGPSGNQFVRLCYARPTAVLRTGLQRLVTFWSK